MSGEFLDQRSQLRGTAARRRIDRLASALVDQYVDHPEAQEYIRSQWRERTLMARVISRRAQEAFYLARWLVVIGATIVPTLVALETRTHGTIETVVQVAAIVLSLLVALAAGALQVTRMGQRWYLYHKLGVQLEHAGWQLFTARGEHAEGDFTQRFAAFVDRVESIVLASQAEYLSQIARRSREEEFYEETTQLDRTPNALAPSDTSPEL